MRPAGDPRRNPQGYEETKDTSIAIEPSEIEAIAPASSTTMEILQFVQAAEVDPIYFDASYYLDPEKVGRPAYKLLAEAMRSSGRVAVAKLAMHQREHSVILRPHGPGLTLHTMFYEAEVRAHDLNLSDVETSSEHLKLAEQLIATLAKPFDPQAFRDEYQARLLDLIESKRRGQPLASAQNTVAAAPVIDMVDALVRSLKRKPPKAETAPVPAEPPQRRRRAAKRKLKENTKWISCNCSVRRGAPPLRSSPSARPIPPRPSAGSPPSIRRIPS